MKGMIPLAYAWTWHPRNAKFLNHLRNRNHFRVKCKLPQILLDDEPPYDLEIHLL